MRKFLILTLLLGTGSLVLALSSAVEAGIQMKNIAAKEKGIQFFTGTWQEAIALAAKENKLIFMDAYATWCGPCKIMAKNTFTDEEVGKFYNKHFINYKMDMENDPEGNRLANKYDLKAYPTLFFIDSNEAIFHSVVGMHQVDDFLALGKEVISK